MLTSTNSNQYLRPEYLSPIQGNTIELDAKKSPLALLAATCSQIGSDGPQKGGQGGLPAGGDLKSSKDPKASPCAKSPSSILSDDSSTTTKLVASFRPYEKKREEEDERSSPSSRKTPITRPSPNEGHLSPHLNGRGSPFGQRSSSRGSETGRPSSSSSASRLASHDIPPHTSSATIRVSSPSSLAPKLASLSSSLGLGSLSGLSELVKDPLAMYKLNPSLYPALGLGFDPIGAASLAALSAKVSSASTTCTSSSSSHSSTASFTSALGSPYISWSRIKINGGSDAVVPVCRDPYCAGCQVNAHAAQVVSGSCASNCQQCAQISAYTKTLSASLPGLLHSLQQPSALSSLYSPQNLLGGGGQQQGNVCSWISGDSYCGKRFTTSEELLQHLRTHTSTSSASSIADVSASLASLHHALHPPHPLLAGHLPRGYPTPPLSPLSARYHPYAAKPSLTHLPPSAHLPPQSALSVASLSALSAPHPLSAYYNPYSIYARGLGATAGLHP